MRYFTFPIQRSIRRKRNPQTPHIFAANHYYMVYDPSSPNNYYSHIRLEYAMETARIIYELDNDK